MPHLALALAAVIRLPGTSMIPLPSGTKMRSYQACYQSFTQNASEYIVPNTSHGWILLTLSFLVEQVRSDSHEPIRRPHSWGQA